MKEYTNHLIKDHEILGVVNNYGLLLFHPGQANDALLKMIEKLSYEAFLEDGYKIEYDKNEIDPYDKIYSHLILWNEETKEIAGWYRFSKTNNIIKKYGIDGLYSSSLFQFNEQVQDELHYGFELGRTFIQLKYRKTLALAYLWGGILKYILREGDIKYIYGLMSIGGDYPSIAKGYIAYFYALYFGRDLNQLVTPINTYFIPEADLSEIKQFIKGNNFHDDFVKLNQQLKLNECQLPNAIKHSMSFCEPEGTQLLAIGIDSSFGDCIDLLSFGEVNKIKPVKLNKYTKLLNAN